MAFSQSSQPTGCMQLHINKMVNIYECQNMECSRTSSSVVTVQEKEKRWSWQDAHERSTALWKSAAKALYSGDIFKSKSMWLMLENNKKFCHTFKMTNYEQPVTFPQVTLPWPVGKQEMCMHANNPNTSNFKSSQSSSKCHVDNSQ